jgi:hypothetical protein
VKDNFITLSVSDAYPNWDYYFEDMEFNPNQVVTIQEHEDGDFEEIIVGTKFVEVTTGWGVFKRTILEPVEETSNEFVTKHKGVIFTLSDGKSYFVEMSKKDFIKLIGFKENYE